MSVMVADPKLMDAIYRKLEYFENKNQDIDHIKKMYSLLAKDGQLITIASSSWTFGSQKKQVEFKRWLEEDVAANWVDLEGGEFKSSGTNVKGTLITINN